MNENINQNLTIANKIKRLGKINLCIHIIAILAFIAWIVTSVLTLTNLDHNTDANILTNTQVGLIVFIAIIVVVYFLCNLVLGINAIIKIASTNWQNESLNQAKTVFWILSLIFIMMILVNPILWIVWGNKVKNSYSLHPQLPEAK